MAENDMSGWARVGAALAPGGGPDDPNGAFMKGAAQGASVSNIMAEASLRRAKLQAQIGYGETLRKQGDLMWEQHAAEAVGGLGSDAAASMQADLRRQEFGARQQAAALIAAGDPVGANRVMMTVANGPSNLTAVSGGILFDPTDGPGQTANVSPVGMSAIAQNEAQARKTSAGVLGENASSWLKENQHQRRARGLTGAPKDNFDGVGMTAPGGKLSPRAKGIIDAAAATLKDAEVHDLGNGNPGDSDYIAPHTHHAEYQAAYDHAVNEAMGLPNPLSSTDLVGRGLQAFGRLGKEHPGVTAMAPHGKSGHGGAKVPIRTGVNKKTGKKVTLYSDGTVDDGT